MEQTFRFNQLFFQRQANRNYQNTLKNFKQSLKEFAIFNIAFVTFFFLELIVFSILLLYFARASIVAISLGVFLFSCFSYFVLLFYFQAKKDDSINLLKDRFIQSCKNSISSPLGTAEHHLTVAQAALRMAEHIKNLDNNFYNFPLSEFVKLKINQIAYMLHKEDLFKFKEQLYMASINEHIEQIHHSPTDLEVHASLANTYSSLSFHYLHAMENSSFPKVVKLSIAQKYRSFVNCAIEEFKILNEYAPNDPWVHTQLAQCYHNLKMHDEETHELELTLKLCPYDHNIMYRLGILYFQTGKTAKGLQIYESLKQGSFSKADEILSYYGSIKTQNAFDDYM